MLSVIFNKKPILHLLAASKAHKAISKGRRVLRTKKNSICSRQLNRTVNFLPHLLDDCAQLVRVERDPTRSAFLGLFRFLRSGFLSYLLLPSGFCVGDILKINYSFSNQLVNFKQTKSERYFCEIKPLVLYTKGSVIHSIESSPLGGFRFCRSAGTSSILEATSLKLGISKVLFPSGKPVFLSASVYASSGALSNEQHYNVKLRKAGQALWKGVRPLSRGVAMNPVDHPHGGGEGKTSGGRPSVSFSAVLSKGYKTLKFKKSKHLRLLKKRFEILG